jgi:hypothetical protein
MMRVLVRARMVGVMAFTRPLATFAASAVTVAVALGGCGGDDKPAYCSDRSNLQDSIQGLTDVDVRGNGISALETQLKAVASDAKSVVSSAKSGFPSQTSALSSSIDALTKSVQALPSSPSAQQIAGVAVAVSSVGSAVTGFTNATSSDC